MSLTPDRPGRRYAIARLGPGGDPSKAQGMPLNVPAVAGRPVTTVVTLPPFTVRQSEDVVFRLAHDDLAIVDRVLVMSAASPASQPVPK